MVSYILLVAVLNIGVGFAVAACLGRRHGLFLVQPLRAAADAFRWGAEAQGQTPAAAVGGGPVVPEAGIAAGASATAAGADLTSDQPAPGACPPTQARSLSPGEASVERLQGEVEAYREELTRADDALRAHAGTADAAAIEACLGSLLTATDEYLRRREEAHQGFEELYKDRSELQGVRESVCQAIAVQDDQIRSSTDLARAFDYQNDLESGCRRMVGETGKLLGANHRLRDAMGAAMVEVARHEQRFAEIDPDLCRDPLTGILDRTGLEARLRAWWRQDPHRMRVLSAALIDVDRFAQLNESFGCQVGDQILRAIAQCLEAEQRGQSVAARFSGQCFLFLFGDVDLRSAINVAERIRQGIELWRFRRRDAEICITVSCAVVEATAEDTPETLFARAEATLREAKRYGRNRTFLHEGKYPTPVVPPSFSLEAKQIDL